MMFKIGTWIRSKIRGTVEVWCVSCQGRQQVVKERIVDGVNNNVPYRRMIGRCVCCNATTSTFLKTS